MRKTAHLFEQTNGVDMKSLTTQEMEALRGGDVRCPPPVVDVHPCDGTIVALCGCCAQLPP